MTTQKVKAALKNFGLPRSIIAGFLLLLLIMAPFVGADLPTQISNIINRFSWNGILVLAMVPMVHSGCGLNFGLPLGIISGLLGATLSIEFGFTGPLSFLAAILIATPFALILGTLYGWLLNKIKGGEMMIATYVGFSSVSFMCMMWLILPYHSPNMVWGLSGKGLRTTISLEGYYNDLSGRILYRRACQFPADQYRIDLDPDRHASVFCPARILHLGIPAHQDRYSYDGSRFEPRLRKGGRHQRRQDPYAVGHHVYMAGGDRYSGL